MAGRKRKAEIVYCRDLAGWWYYRITNDGFEVVGGRQAVPIVDPAEHERMQRFHRDATNELMSWRTRGAAVGEE